jgi:hypothetical protein
VLDVREEERNGAPIEVENHAHAVIRESFWTRRDPAPLLTR